MNPSKPAPIADASRWDQSRPGAELVEAQLRQADLVPESCEPATGSVDKRNDEWLGLWRQPGPPPSPEEIESC